MTVGERIKKLRIEKGLSQEELAKRAGYADKTAICKIERSGDDVSTEGEDCGKRWIFLSNKKEPPGGGSIGEL